MRAPALIILIAACTCACDATGEGSMGTKSVVTEVVSGGTELDARIKRAQDELSRIEAEIEAKRKEASFLSCKAEVEDLKADVGLARAQCMFELAEQAECKANVERSKGDSSLFGCVLGLAAAVYTGGSAAPWALGGCAAGRVAGEMSAKECPLPVCAKNSEQMMLSALEQRGWPHPPQCGGRLGIEVETPSLGLVGVLRVIEPGRLGKAGIEKGDSIAYVSEERIKTPVSFATALEAHAGSDVEIGFVRDDKLYKGHLTVPSKPSSLRYRLEKANRVTHKWSARVRSLSEDSPLVGRVDTGRDITHVDGEEVADVDHLRQLLRYRRTGEEVTLSLRTPGTLETDAVVVKLGDRADQWSL